MQDGKKVVVMNSYYIVLVSGGILYMEGDIQEKQLISTPQQYDNRFRTTSPSMWLIVIAIAVMMAGFVVWLFFGHIELDVHTRFIAVDDVVYCWLPLKEAGELRPGMEVMYDRTKGTVVSVGDYAELYDEIRSFTGKNISWLTVSEDDRNYRIEIEMDTGGDKLGELRIIKKREHPIALIMNLADYQR